MGANFVEGVADYYTKMACAKHNPKIPFVARYSEETDAIHVLAAAVGEDALAGLVFKGDEARVAQIVDSKSKGTWSKYKEALSAGKYAKAADLLGGVREADDKSVRKEAADVQAGQRASLAHDLADANNQLDAERKTWPEEATQPVSGRQLMSEARGTTSYVGVSMGGLHGVREGWKARAKLHNGSTVEGVVREVKTRFSRVEFPGAQTMNEIVGNIELRPASSR